MHAAIESIEHSGRELAVAAGIDARGSWMTTGRSSLSSNSERRADP
ncbi:MAG: hypothetical protein HYV09_21395 [Deltaproteobacteria bacterium]|nr:hypothetical protein [Deltaproteobacteria bacterium]